MTAVEKGKQDIIEIGRRLHRRGYVAASAGNFSIKLDEDRILITPTGLCKGYLTPDQIVTVDMGGKKRGGAFAPSSELPTHLKVYSLRKDVRGIVHAHPPVSTAFGVAGIPLDQDMLPEAILTLGSIPLARYRTPSTQELAETTSKFLRDCDAVLMSNHGAITVGPDIYDAYFKMETFEHFALITLLTRFLGEANVLSKEEVGVLRRLRGKDQSS